MKLWMRFTIKSITWNPGKRVLVPRPGKRECVEGSEESELEVGNNLCQVSYWFDLPSSFFFVISLGTVRNSFITEITQTVW